MNVHARFNEIPSMTLQDIEETKEKKKKKKKKKNVTDSHTDNLKTVYPPSNSVCGDLEGIR